MASALSHKILHHMYITHAQMALAWDRVGDTGIQSADAYTNEAHAFLMWPKLLSRSSVLIPKLTVFFDVLCNCLNIIHPQSVKFSIISLLFQTVLAQLTDSPVPFPFPVESIANMLEPLADYACNFVGVK